MRESGVGFLHGLRQGPDGSHVEHLLLFLFGQRAQGPEFSQIIEFFGLAFVQAPQAKEQVLDRVGLGVISECFDRRPVFLFRFVRLVLLPPCCADEEKGFCGARTIRVLGEKFPHQLAQAFVVLLQLENLGQFELRILVEASGTDGYPGIDLLALIRLGLGQQRVAEEDTRFGVFRAVGIFFQVGLEFLFGCFVVAHGLRAVSVTEGGGAVEHAFGVFAGKGGQNLPCLGELFREGQSRPVPISGRLAEFVIRVFRGKLSEQFGGFVVALGQQLGESLHKKSTGGLLGVGELVNEPAKGLHGGIVIPGLLLGHTLQIKNKRKLLRLREASGKKKCRLDRFVIALDRDPTLQGGERCLLDHRIRIHLA